MNATEEIKIEKMHEIKIYFNLHGSIILLLVKPFIAATFKLERWRYKSKICLSGINDLSKECRLVFDNGALGTEKKEQRFLGHWDWLNLFQKEISFLLPTIKFQTAERQFCRGEIHFRVLKMERHARVL